MASLNMVLLFFIFLCIDMLPHPHCTLTPTATIVLQILSYKDWVQWCQLLLYYLDNWGRRITWALGIAAGPVSKQHSKIQVTLGSISSILTSQVLLCFVGISSHPEVALANESVFPIVDSVEFQLWSRLSLLKEQILLLIGLYIP